MLFISCTLEGSPQRKRRVFSGTSRVVRAVHERYGGFKDDAAIHTGRDLSVLIC